MASRRDELNAYTFARKRTVGAFLQPSGGGNDEDAPRPVRAVLPSFVVAVVLVVGCGMLGVYRPSAPLNWDNGKSILQGKQSSARYVVLEDPNSHEKYLHQVLNMSSAKLVLPAGAQVMTVADDVLDKYKNHGATIGIPYAPDKLPKDSDAGQAKKWSVCDRPGPEGVQSTIAQSVFVAADEEAKKLEKPGLMLADGQSLFVQAPQLNNEPRPAEYLVDANGFKHAIGNEGTLDLDRRVLEAALFTREAAQPEQVTAEWLRTLESGEPITFPKMPADFGSPSKLNLARDADRRAGRLLKYQNNSYFVVGATKLYAVTPFMAEMIRNNPQEGQVYGGDQPTFGDLTTQDYSQMADKIDSTTLKAPANWPVPLPAPPVNAPGKNQRSVVCSTFEEFKNNTVRRSVWADVDYPAPVSAGSGGAHVTPGHGLLFRAVDGDTQGGSGVDFLITETGLRYALPVNSDGPSTPGAGSSPAPGQSGGGQQSTNESQARLGYKGVTPVAVPKTWALLVPAGPVLNTSSAQQAQNA